MKDALAFRSNKILDEVLNERLNQDDKWGLQNHCPKGWLMILAEEFGEANKAVLESCVFKDGRLSSINREMLKKGKDSYRNELIQIAAVAVAMVECLDRDEW